MPRKKPTFSQADLTRALKGAEAAGIKVGRFSIDPNGRIDIILVGDVTPDAADEFDSWKAKRNAR